VQRPCRWQRCHALSREHDSRIGFEQLRPAVEFAAVEVEQTATDGVDPAAPARSAAARR
jgi:hypothetical protein